MHLNELYPTVLEIYFVFRISSIPWDIYEFWNVLTQFLFRRGSIRYAMGAKRAAREPRLLERLVFSLIVSSSPIESAHMHTWLDSVSRVFPRVLHEMAVTKLDRF